MPFLAIIIGLALVITAIQDTYAPFGAQLAKDFGGPNGFIVWMLAILAVGAIGYAQGWEKFSRYFLALMILAIVLAQYKNSGGNLISSFINQVKNPVAPQTSSGTGSVSSSAFGVPSAAPSGGWWGWITGAPTLSLTNPFASK